MDKCDILDSICKEKLNILGNIYMGSCNILGNIRNYSNHILGKVYEDNNNKLYSMSIRIRDISKLTFLFIFINNGFFLI